MSASRLVENHHRRLMSYYDIDVTRNQSFWMVIGQSEEFHSVNLYSTVLQEIHIRWQVLYTLRIPKAKVVVTRDEYLVRISQFDIPVQEVKHLFFCAVIGKVTSMYEYISRRHILKPVV